MDIVIHDDNQVVFGRNEEYPRLYLRYAEIYLNDLIRCTGYIYLNEIYKYLDAKWDPNNDNVCIRSCIEFVVFYIAEHDDNLCNKLIVSLREL